MTLFFIHGTVGPSFSEGLFEFRRQRENASLNVLTLYLLRNTEEHAFKNLADASENVGSYYGLG